MIFIDAGALVAWYRESNAHRKVAAGAWARLEKSGRRRFTSALVVDEVMRLLSRYGGVRAATRAGRALLSSSTTILSATTEDGLNALDLIDKFADQPIGYTDCISFILMKKNRIETVFGFDRHFRVAGFELWPVQK